MKKTILHIISDLTRGGAEVMLVRVLKELTEYNNIVVTLGTKDHFGKELVCDEFYCMNTGSMSKLPLAVMRLRKFMKSRKIDLVHSHLFSATVTARLATPSSIPIITTIHTNVSNREYNKWYMKAIERFSYKKHRSTIIGVSPGVLDQYFSFFDHKPYKKYLLYTFVDIQETAKAIPAETETDRNTMFRLVAIGALRYPKNQQYLIRAFEKLRGRNFELHIYGTGIQKNELEQLIAQTGANVLLKGEVKNASRLLNQYDLYVMPSEFEGFSLSILEAMAMEIPMLVSDIPSFREQCADTAVFFDLEDTGDFIRKLEELATDKEKRKQLAVSAKKRVLGNFTLEHHMAGLRKIYTDTLNNG